MTYFDVQRFAAQIKTKRGTRSLRLITKDIGETGGDVSISTLSRLEREGIPDMATFIAICDWLGVEPDEFMLTPQRPKAQRDPLKDIELILRNETWMAPDTIAAIMAILRIAQRDAENDGGA